MRSLWSASLVASRPAVFLSGDASRSIRSKSAKNVYSWAATSGCLSRSSWRLGTWPDSTACI